MNIYGSFFSNFQRFYGSYGDPVSLSVKILLFQEFYGSFGDPITAHFKNQGIYSRDNYSQVLDEQSDLKGSA